MPSKDFILDNGLPVIISKRKGNRNLRLSIGPSGQVRVSMPAWLPYKAGLDFARSRQAWIQEQHQPPQLLQHGQAIGKSHHLQFAAAPLAHKPTSRVSGTTVLVTYPVAETPHSPAVQRIAERAGVRALRQQAEQLLPQRLAYLAALHGFSYRAVSIKQLKGRWGSCDQHHNIVLNLFLMQLPWNLIDYVLLHELTHTRILRHGPDFWRAMTEVSPPAKALRKQLRAHHPVIGDTRQITPPMA